MRRVRKGRCSGKTRPNGHRLRGVAAVASAVDKAAVPQAKVTRRNQPYVIHLLTARTAGIQMVPGSLARGNWVVNRPHCPLARRSRLLYPPTMYETALAELRARWRDGNHYVGRDDISRWSEQSGLSPSSIFDRLAVELASDFWVGFLGWEFADGAANALHGALLEFATSTDDFRWPKNFEEFYLSFDHSEMNGPRDRELIREFLQKHKTLMG